MLRMSVVLEYLKYLFIFFISYIISKFYSRNEEFKNLWIISERGYDARDNGFVFFEYIRRHHPELNVAYVIDKNSPDYIKVKKIGKTINYSSFKHYISIFLAKKLISTHIMGYTPCPGFFVTVDKRHEVFKGKKVFLQHGITKDDIEGLKYPNTKVDLFICGAKAEYDFIQKKYNYPKGVVKYTGLARFDNLESSSEINKKQILIMPTWRKWLNSREEDFKSSDYFSRYQSLLSNIELNRIVNENNYKIVFYPHYEVQKYLNLFSGNENIEIANFEKYDVATLLRESEILITDYSSVYFDFAYMRKQILFYQFDQEKFSNDHYQKGYIDENLFGKIVFDEIDLIEEIKRTIYGSSDRNDFSRDLDDFFIYHDKENCKRIYNAIMEMKK